ASPSRLTFRESRGSAPSLEGVRYSQATRAVHRALRLEGRQVQRRGSPNTRGHGSVGMAHDDPSLARPRGCRPDQTPEAGAQARLHRRQVSPGARERVAAMVRVTRAMNEPREIVL